MMVKKCFLSAFGLLVTLCMANGSQSSLMETEEDGTNVFNFSDEDFEEPFVVQMPNSCAGKTFCFDKGQNYPDARIADLLKDYHNLKEYTQYHNSDIDDRLGAYNKDCLDDKSEGPIYYIKDTNNETRVVVQSDTKFMQIYTARWCLKPGPITEETPHFLKNRPILESFRVECVDSVMYFDFYVLVEEMDPGTGTRSDKMEVVKGGIPVCCRCRYDPVLK